MVVYFLRVISVWHYITICTREGVYMFLEFSEEIKNSLPAGWLLQLDGPDRNNVCGSIL